MSRRFWITTPDNPFDPITEYEEWQAYDHEKGYYTSEYVARVAILANDLGENAILHDTEDAIDRIIDLYPKGTYKKVVSEDKSK